jgi:hypothetical protein
LLQIHRRIKFIKKIIKTDILIFLTHFNKQKFQIINNKKNNFMTKRIIFMGLIALIMSGAALNAQVGINTETPKATLEVVANSSSNVAPGIIIPVMSKEQRDAIENSPNSLIIFNTDENCLNYYFGESHQWLSLCGSEPPASLTIDCGEVSVSGNYIKGMACGGGNYLQIPIMVNTPGNFTILGTTKRNNGYSFSYSGTATVPGAMLVNVPAQGTPAAIQVDTVMIKVNNLTLEDCNSAIIDVFNPAATYTITSCSENHFGGSYIAGTTVTSANTDTVYVNVPADTYEEGQNLWSITTNTVDGISFSGSGMFTTTGPQKVVLYAQGTPVNSKDKVFTYTTNSLDPAQQEANCKTTLKMTLNKMTVWYWNQGYNAFYTAASRAVFQNPASFGPLASSKQPVQGITMTDGGGLTATLRNALASATPPDIVWLFYDINIDAQTRTALVDYVKKGGVLVYSSDNSSTLDFFSSLYGTTIGGTYVNTNYRDYPLLNTGFAGDPVVGGPFATFGAASSGAQYNYWAENTNGGTGGTWYLTGLPSSEIIYATNQNNSNNALVAGSATFFRSTQYNVVYVGNGGWTSPQAYYNGNQSGNPFRYSGSGTNTVPAAQMYGYNPYVLTNNAALACNIMAWAIRQAQWTGINSKNYK